MLPNSVIIDTSQTDLDLDSRSQECKQTNTSASIISQNFVSIWMEFGILLRLVSVMNFRLLYLTHLVLKGENPTFVRLFFCLFGLFIFFL